MNFKRFGKLILVELYQVLGIAVGAGVVGREAPGLVLPCWEAWACAVGCRARGVSGAERPVLLYLIWSRLYHGIRVLG